MGVTRFWLLFCHRTDTNELIRSHVIPVVMFVFCFIVGQAAAGWDGGCNAEQQDDNGRENCRQ